jgi:NADH dehydrogenase [ubiquinone] 1 alpha subcomplex assembly factor 7
VSADLASLIRARIVTTGPISVAEYMSWCLGHPRFGYYMQPGRIGAAGDFTTAPEISQMFGELIGAWLAQVWHDQGRPAPFVLAELGPGRGTLIADLLRATARLPGFLDVADLRLVETSPTLREVQRTSLGSHRACWAERVEDLPEGPLFLVANEFFDALPIRQFRRTDAFWRERMVGIGRDGGLAFDWGRPTTAPVLDAEFGPVADGTVVETNPVGDHVAACVGARIARSGGAALIVDYGAWDGTGDTLQAVRDHAFADPLDDPGAADLTTHVRFRALAEAARPAAARGPVTQGAFLERLGIVARAQILAGASDGPALDRHVAALRRLTHPGEMGHLFKAMALLPETAPVPPGFEA